jgi:hypothetical protein
MLDIYIHDSRVSVSYAAKALEFIGPFAKAVLPALETTDASDE